MPRRRRISPSKLLERVVERVNAKLIDLNREYSEYLNSLMMDPPIWFEVEKLIRETICEEIFGDNEEKVDDCISDLYDIIDELVKYYNKPFIETWIEIKYTINEKIFEKSLEKFIEVSE